MKTFLMGLCLLPLLLPLQSHSQQEESEGGAFTVESTESASGKLTPESAASLLAQPVPETADARYALLQRQLVAARTVEDRVRHIDILKQLIEAGAQRPNGDLWILDYLNAEFTWGSSGKALNTSEQYVSNTSLPLGTRAALALRQSYFAAQGNDRAVLNRYWSRADALSTEALKLGNAPGRIRVERLQVRSEIERFQGDSAAAVSTLRQAVGQARKELQLARAKSKNPQDPATLEAYGWLDGSLGMLTYALIRQGRPQEAIDIALANVALWRAGQISEGLGARWNYRLANGLLSTQQFAAGLVAARTSDDMLQRAGASAASHTRWLARQELVRALIGLKRWKEADASYREFLASMPEDALARTRASDWRLLALLAAENGRFTEAQQLVERIHRYRVRLYGNNHPQTQEAAGVRAVVRLLQGDVNRAMSDYDALFAATLDNPAGWLDLNQRGVRGYVLGIAFDEFMRYVSDRALKGQSVEARMSDRAMQIADRNSLGVTQSALSDSSARLMANTPALHALLEQEQSQRQVVAALVTKVNESLMAEDRTRRETQTDEFKALAEADRKPLLDKLKEIQAQIKSQQGDVNIARTLLITQRDAIAKQFPAYADLVTPATPKPEQLQRLLSAGEALLVVQPAETATLVWLVKPDLPTQFLALPLTREDLARRVSELRALMEQGGTQDSTAVAPLALLHALYKDMLQPLEAHLNGVRSLIVASDGPLAGFPLAALVTAPAVASAAPSWLVRSMAVTQIPSASSLLALRRTAAPPAASKALLGFGDPLFKLSQTSAQRQEVGDRKAKRLGGTLAAGAAKYDAEWGFRYADVPPLPETRGELLAIATALGADTGTDLILGAKATRRAVLEANLLDRRVVAFATHGLMPGELPGISKPALAMAANVDPNESPLLELDDVLSLRLNAQWVLLSACNTAAGEKGNGAMSGLVRGFFFTGARSVLATHWAVDSDSAAALSSATFVAYAKGAVTRGESLRQAQLAMVDGSLGAGQWKHPYHWAPYALFGDPAR